MDIFGGWENYTERIEKNWNSVVGEDDCVVIPGDISWAMSIEEALRTLSLSAEGSEAGR